MSDGIDWDDLPTIDPLMFPDGDDTDLEDAAEVARVGEPITKAPYDTMAVNGVIYPLGSASATDLGRFEGKMTTGPYTADSDDTLSAWISNNWGGGQLINLHIPGGTDARFRAANAWTLNAQQLTLPPKLERSAPYGVVYNGMDGDTTPPPNVFNASCPIGEFNGGFFYAIGSQLFKVTTIPNSFDDLDLTPIESLMFPPVDIGVIYGPPLADHSLPERRPRLWVPLGSRGIQNIRDNDGLSPLEPDIKAIALKTYDRSMWAFTVEGYLRQYTQWDGDMGGTWAAATTEMKVSSDQRPMAMDVFYDRAGNQTIFLLTDKQMWAYDPNTFSVVPTQLLRPKHPDNGWGFTAWRDDAIYSTAGIGFDRYSRDGVRTQVGLDRDDSVAITQLSGIYPVLGENGDPFTSQFGTGKGTVPPAVPFIGSTTGSLNYLIAGMGRGFRQEVIDGVTHNYSRMSIELYNEGGWATVADWEVHTRGCWITPGPMVMSETVGGYRLWMGQLSWGTDMSVMSGPETPLGIPIDQYEGDVGLVSMQLPRHFHGPRQLVTKNVGRFEHHGYMETGWFDSAMRGFDKLWSHFEVYLSQPDTVGGSFPENAFVDVFYRTEDDPNTWIELGRANEYGRNVMPFGVQPDGFPAGASSQMIELRYELYSDEEAFTPIIEATVLKYLKIPLPGRAWLMQIPFDATNQLGWGPKESDRKLADLTVDPAFVRMVHQDKEWRARIAQHQAIGGQGADAPFFQSTINVVTVEIPGYDWRKDPFFEDDNGE